MSLETDQTLVQLSVIAGVLATYDQGRIIANLEVRRAAEQCFEHVREAIIRWPLMSCRTWVKQRREEFKTYVEATDDRHWTHNAILANIQDMIVADIMDVGLVGEKLSLIAPIAEHSRTLYNFFDPTFGNFPAMDVANDVVAELRKIIWWNRNHKDWR